MDKEILNQIIRYCEDKDICNKLENFGDFYNQIKLDIVNEDVIKNVIEYCEYEQIYDKLTLYGSFYYKLKFSLR